MSWIALNSDVTIDGNVITINSANAGPDSKYSVLYKDDALSSGGMAAWEFRIIDAEEPPFIGMTNEANFQDGYKLRGYMYHGNLSNGAALVKGNWGPLLKAGDILTMGATLKDGKLKICYELNGCPLGCAFELTTFLTAPLFPVVSASNKTKVCVQKVNRQIPQSRAVHVDKSTIAGDWKFISITKDGQSVTPVCGTLKIEGGAGSNRYDAIFKVANTIIYTFTDTNGTWSAAGGTSTMMMPFGDAQAVESAIQSIKGLNKADMTEEGNVLKLSGTGFEFVLTRFSEVAEAATEVDVSRPGQ